MLFPKRQSKPSVQEPKRQGAPMWKWRSLKVVGEALIVITVPGALVVWLGREIWKRGMPLSGDGWIGVGSNWIHRRLAWASHPVQKTIR